MEGGSVKSLKTVLGVKECSECENHYRSFHLKTIGVLVCGKSMVIFNFFEGGLLCVKN